MLTIRLVNHEKELIISNLRKRKLDKRNRKSKLQEKNYFNNQINRYYRDECLFLSKSSFSKNRRQKLTRINDGVTIKIPKCFSLIENPNESLRVFQQIYSAYKDKNINKVHFDHTACTTLGICSSTVMDVLIIAMKNQRLSCRKSFELSGDVVENTRVNDILDASGLKKHLNLSVLSEENEKEKGIVKLELQVGGKTSKGQLKGTMQDYASTKVVEYLVKCYERSGCTINKEGQKLIGNMVGEIIDNCENHSGEFCKWYCLGHFQMADNASHGEVSLVIFNFGKTIYSGLKNDCVTPEMYDKLTNKSKMHINFFGINWTEEMLWTLYALQDGVSKEWIDDDSDRGSGTIRFIESFEKIGNTADGKKARMCILSGKTHILFDGTYFLEDKDIAEGTRKVVAFNKENDLNIPPDKSKVTNLARTFPGTIISMNFFIDPSYIESLKNRE